MNFDEIKKAVVEFEVDLVKQLVNQMLQEKIGAALILENGLIAGMKEVGERFTRKEYFVPEVLLASEAFYSGWELIRKNFKIKGSCLKSKAKIIIGVVEGDIHDIGKNIVKVMLEASGYSVVDLGKDVPVKKFIESVAKEKPQILGLSSLMTTTMVKMEEVIKGLEEKKLRKNIKIIIGGAPVNEDYARKIGADGYGEDAAQAVKVVEGLIGQ